ncbi:MAG: rod shape-determining protein MreC [Bacillota bacterium]|nr:MAG: rod shape-determining protein MreC [Bacillota bacterium]
MLPPPHLRRTTRSTLTWVLVVLTGLMLTFTLIAVTSGDRRTASLPENLLATVLYPFQNAAGWVTGRVRDVTGGIRELMYLREENARLREQVERLIHLERLNEQLAQENQRLREELGLQDRLPHRLIAAQVIARDPSLWFQAVVINRGARHGVREGLVVVNHQGIVGLVERVTPFTSTVRLMTAGNFEITARNLRNGEFGVVEGQGDGVVVRFPYGGRDAVRQGDVIVTGWFQPEVPEGLYIGAVAEVERGDHDLIPVGVLRPGVDFQHLDLVQVVVPEPPGEEAAQ